MGEMDRKQELRLARACRPCKEFGFSSKHHGKRLECSKPGNMKMSEMKRNGMTCDTFYNIVDDLDCELRYSSPLIPQFPWGLHSGFSTAHVQINF